MGREKTGGKDTYRKKPFSGETIRDLAKEYQDFVKEFREVSNDPTKLIGFITDKFGIPGIEERNPDLKIIVFLCKDEGLRKSLIDLGNKGANLRTIWDVLETPRIDEYLIDGHPVGLQLYGGELTPHWNDAIENFHKKRKVFLKQKRIIRNAVRLIAALEPITLKHSYKNELPLINERLLGAQRALNEVIDPYLDAKAIKDGLIGYPAKWGLPVAKLVREKFKPLTQSSHKIWNHKIVILVNELKRIGYTDRQAYKRTAELLHSAFPTIYTDKDPDLVRQRYSHQKAKR